MSAGIYMLKSGPFFYIGSSTNFRTRKADHSWRLKANIHPASQLQKNFNESGTAEFTPLIFARKLKSESDTDFKERIRSMEQTSLDYHAGSPFLQNKSPNANGPNNGKLLQQLWQDPEWRKYRSAVTKKSKINVTPETRLKMATAKTGARNHKSRAVIVTNPDRSTQTFPSTTCAAKFFGASQQLLEQWIKGLVPWPGTGKFVRAKYAWIADYSAKFADMP